MVEIHGPNWMIRRSANTDIEVMDILCELSQVTRCGTFVLDQEHSTPEKTIIHFIKKVYPVELKPPTDNIET